MFTQMGIVTDSEFVRLVGSAPKDVGAKPVEAKNEEGEKKNMYVMSLRGLPLEELLSIRKIEISHSVSVDHIEHLLLQEKQLTQDQGMVWAESTCKQQIKTRPSSVTNAGLAGLHTLEYYQKKAAEIEKRRQEQMGAEAEEDEADEEDNLLDQMDGEVPSSGVRPVHEAVPEAGSAFGSILSTTASATGKSRAKKKRGSKKDEEEEDADNVSSIGFSGRMNPLEIARVDPEMAPVAKKHEMLTNRVSPSLANLQIKRFLDGEKLGQAITGVRLSVELSDKL